MGTDDDYEDDFEDDDESFLKSKNVENADILWESIKFRDIVVAEQIGGGGVGIVYKGFYNGEPVALKTLVHCRFLQNL